MVLLVAIHDATLAICIFIFSVFVVRLASILVALFLVVWALHHIAREKMRWW